VIRFVFNERKAAQAAAHVLKGCGGRLEYIKLIKLLYLADREMLTKRGRTITGDRLVSMKHGPVLSFIYELICDGPDENGRSPWFQHISPKDGYFVRVESGGDTDELSAFEVSTLDAIVAKYGGVDKWRLVDIVHKFPEWKDPGSSSSDIEPEDILKAEGWDEPAIREAALTAAEARLISFG
jgi:uncharacterized phage-associated protein